MRAQGPTADIVDIIFGSDNTETQDWQLPSGTHFEIPPGKVPSGNLVQSSNAPKDIVDEIFGDSGIPSEPHFGSPWTPPPQVRTDVGRVQASHSGGEGQGAFLNLQVPNAGWQKAEVDNDLATPQQARKPNDAMPHDFNTLTNSLCADQPTHMTPDDPGPELQDLDAEFEKVEQKYRLDDSSQPDTIRALLSSGSSQPSYEERQLSQRNSVDSLDQVIAELGLPEINSSESDISASWPRLCVGGEPSLSELLGSYSSAVSEAVNTAAPPAMSTRDQSITGPASPACVAAEPFTSQTLSFTHLQLPRASQPEAVSLVHVGADPHRSGVVTPDSLDLILGDQQLATSQLTGYISEGVDVYELLFGSDSMAASETAEDFPLPSNHAMAAPPEQHIRRGQANSDDDGFVKESSLPAPSSSVGPSVNQTSQNAHSDSRGRPTAESDESIKPLRVSADHPQTRSTPQDFSVLPQEWQSGTEKQTHSSLGQGKPAFQGLAPQPTTNSSMFDTNKSDGSAVRKRLDEPLHLPPIEPLIIQNTKSLVPFREDEPRPPDVPGGDLTDAADPFTLIFGDDGGDTTQSQPLNLPPIEPPLLVQFTPRVPHAPGGECVASAATNGGVTEPYEACSVSNGGDTTKTQPRHSSERFASQEQASPLFPTGTDQLSCLHKSGEDVTDDPYTLIFGDDTTRTQAPSVTPAELQRQAHPPFASSDEAACVSQSGDIVRKVTETHTVVSSGTRGYGTQNQARYSPSTQSTSLCYHAQVELTSFNKADGGVTNSTDPYRLIFGDAGGDTSQELPQIEETMRPSAQGLEHASDARRFPGEPSENATLTTDPYALIFGGDDTNDTNDTRPFQLPPMEPLEFHSQASVAPLPFKEAKNLASLGEADQGVIGEPDPYRLSFGDESEHTFQDQVVCLPSMTSASVRYQLTLTSSVPLLAHDRPPGPKSATVGTNGVTQPTAIQASSIDGGNVGNSQPQPPHSPFVPPSISQEQEYILNSWERAEGCVTDVAPSCGQNITGLVGNSTHTQPYAPLMQPPVLPPDQMTRSQQLMQGPVLPPDQMTRSQQLTDNVRDQPDGHGPIFRADVSHTTGTVPPPQPPTSVDPRVYPSFESPLVPPSDAAGNARLPQGSEDSVTDQPDAHTLIFGTDVTHTTGTVPPPQPPTSVDPRVYPPFESPLLPPSDAAGKARLLQGSVDGVTDQPDAHTLIFGTDVTHTTETVPPPQPPTSIDPRVYPPFESPLVPPSDAAGEARLLQGSVDGVTDQPDAHTLIFGTDVTHTTETVRPVSPTLVHLGLHSSLLSPPVPSSDVLGGMKAPQSSTGGVTEQQDAHTFIFGADAAHTDETVSPASTISPSHLIPRRLPAFKGEMSPSQGVVNEPVAFPAPLLFAAHQRRGDDQLVEPFALLEQEKTSMSTAETRDRCYGAMPGAPSSLRASGPAHIPVSTERQWMDQAVNSPFDGKVFAAWPAGGVTKALERELNPSPSQVNLGALSGTAEVLSTRGGPSDFRMRESQQLVSPRQISHLVLDESTVKAGTCDSNEPCDNLVLSRAADVPQRLPPLPRPAPETFALSFTSPKEPMEQAYQTQADEVPDDRDPYTLIFGDDGSADVASLGPQADSSYSATQDRQSGDMLEQSTRNSTCHPMLSKDLSLEPCRETPIDPSISYGTENVNFRSPQKETNGEANGEALVASGKGGEPGTVPWTVETPLNFEDTGPPTPLLDKSERRTIYSHLTGGIVPPTASLAEPQILSNETSRYNSIHIGEDKLVDPIESRPLLLSMGSAYDTCEPLLVPPFDEVPPQAVIEHPSPNGVPSTVASAPPLPTHSITETGLVNASSSYVDRLVSDRKTTPRVLSAAKHPTPKRRLSYTCTFEQRVSNLLGTDVSTKLLRAYRTEEAYEIDNMMRSYQSPSRHEDITQDDSIKNGVSDPVSNGNISTPMQDMQSAPKETATVPQEQRPPREEQPACTPPVLKLGSVKICPKLFLTLNPDGSVRKW
eukprot:Blabericola_migrator_1__8674@NODE_455_length_8321_cov_35_402229_g356_i0_p1_GENE_NODE_455_length_8321_cov_35_402229_g356_i0NODE_455_length_8321_cov_35_402229_g356_i0_p1_ORF_typecomplete_len2049_score351_43DUF4429/PF14472_6/1_9e02DUF4429/PF14472_6/1_6e04DUF4429/PF14472_6/2_7e03DUF4429/PF14472_6/2_7e03DUF4429/PF14472_6/6_1e03DUF4429/PF14472_6/1_7e02DUF3622/PF12286_8/0_37_NODE_455_length_8321_cov_35_402229_g356_i021748134